MSQKVKNLEADSFFSNARKRYVLSLTPVNIEFIARMIVIHGHLGIRDKIWYCTQDIPVPYIQYGHWQKIMMINLHILT
jgi:hypothetical protein